MIVARGCARTKVVSATAGEERWLVEYLTFESANAFWIRKAGGSGKVVAYNQFSRQFPSGLLGRVVADAAADGFRVEVLDQRVRPCEPQPVAAWGVPALAQSARPDQMDALRAAVRAQVCLIKMPTGSGKTRVGVMLTQALPCRWLVIVPQIHLLDQAAAEFEGLTREGVGRCGDSQWSVERVTVSTYQILYAGLISGSERVETLLGSVGGVLVDEAHQAAADSISGVLLRTDRAYWRVGLSATPLARGDQKSTMTVACLGPIAYQSKTTDLQDAGVLARPTVYMVPYQHAPAASSAANPAAAYARDVVLCAGRNDILVEAIRQAAKPCLVFVKHVKHGRHLARRVAQAGIAQEFVWGQASRQQRKDVVSRLANGVTDVVVASPVFDQGVDIPCLASVVVATAGSSVIATLQRIGRGSRTDGGKKMTFEVWDVMDRGSRLLTPQARTRQRTYVREGHAVVERALVPTGRAAGKGSRVA